RACAITGAPVKATLLDEQLVIYRIKGQVVVARDVCPHRGVPLTLGFHEEEGIVCPYHGLRFGEEGRGHRIPCGPGQPSRARRHLAGFAVEERYGLIWTCLACG
ncbi:molybdenum cofactor-independent xanthine hydroxylase subunit HpxD, partial [Mycobacterium tuberculosis]|nr:molybdenum cofactor-independent xanthine hydroxylase subunit HpxD [Mycobacterium tuberculosis]